MPDPFDDLQPADENPSEQIADANLDAEVARLADLSSAEYETERKAAAKRLNVRAAFLDGEVTKARQDASGTTGNTDEAEIVETLEAWPDPVDGASLAEEIRECLGAHVVFGATGDADAATLWIFGSYLIDTWRLWPRLMITSPTKACGKSTLLEVIDAMAHRGLIISNTKSAGVFRAIEAWRPTLLMDEADTWMREDQELAGILNSGHTRRTARVIRVQDKAGELVPTLFSTWCAMVIAGIGGQADTLMSRSIIIGLRRKLPDEQVQRLPIDLHKRMTRVRRQAARWASDNALTLGAMDDEPPDCGNDRRRDNFTPLHRIARVIGGVWPDRLAAAYAASAQIDRDENEPAGVMMLRDVKAQFDDRKTDRLPTSEVVGDLIVMDDRPWAEWRHGRPVSSQSVAKLLKPFEVRPKVMKLAGGSSARCYMRNEVEAAAKRYASETPPPTRNPVTYQQIQPVRAFPKRYPEAGVTPSNPDNPLENKQGYAVTPENPDWADFE